MNIKKHMTKIAITTAKLMKRQLYFFFDFICSVLAISKYLFAYFVFVNVVDMF